MTTSTVRFGIVLGASLWLGLLGACDRQRLNGGDVFDHARDAAPEAPVADALSSAPIADAVSAAPIADAASPSIRDAASSSVPDTASVPDAASSTPDAAAGPQLLATTSHAWGVAVDDTNVYVAAQAAEGDLPLVAIPLAGGSPSPLSAASSFTVVLDDTHVYWGDKQSVFACAKRDCTGTTVRLGANQQAIGLALDATSVYWATSDGAIMKVSKTGGTARTLAKGIQPYLLAVDEANIYWTDRTSVMKMPTAGGTPVQLASSDPFGSIGITLDSKNVYFTVGDGKVVRVSKEGGDPLTLATDLGNEPWGIATDGMNVYVATHPGKNSGKVVRVPVDGGTETVVGWGGFLAGIAVDATFVYWADLTTGQVMRVAK